MKTYLAEFTGTFCLVLFGTASIVINDHFNAGIGLPGIAAVFGLTVMAVVYSLGPVSGAHINPAVTISFWLAGSLSPGKVIPYMLFQFTGALTASYVMWNLFPEHPDLGSTLPHGSAWQSLGFEIFMSFLLMLVILHVSAGSGKPGMIAGFSIGAVVTLDALIGGQVSGASMNPARSFGPAVISRHISDLWIYFVGPVSGMILSIPAWKLINYINE